MTDKQTIRRIVAEWLNKPSLKQYEEIGKKYMTEVSK